MSSADSTTTTADSTTAAAESASTSPQNLTIYASADTFGCVLKGSLLPRLQSFPNTTIIDLGVDKYYKIGAKIGSLVSSAARKGPQNGGEVRGLLICGTGAGVAIFANKYPGVYAVTCRDVADAMNARSINNSNVIALSGAGTLLEEAVRIMEAWVVTPFKSPCPASMVKPWPDEILDFLENAPKEMAAIPEKVPEEVKSGCAICCLRNGMEFEPVGIMPGGEMRIVRESPTSAYVRFKAGSVEPAHHHTFGHDLVVIKGKKKVWNLTKNESYGLVDGDFLFTPAGDVHRVKYFEDTEFFIRWDGHWDIFLDEDLDAAKAAIDKELEAAAK